MNILVLAIGFIGLFGLLSLDWRKTVKLALVTVVLEGMLRKWILPQASDLIYFLKDIILLIAYVKYYSIPNPQYHSRKSFINLMIFISFAWGLFQVFNPNLGSPIVGWFGLKAYFFYIPLIWIMPTLFRNQEELYIFLRNYLLLVIPIGILAIVQYFSPASSPLNIYAGGVEANAFVGGNPRVTGTFSYLSGYAVYLSFCLAIIIPVLFYQQTKIWNILTIAELILIVGTSFMTGARGLIIFEILFFGGYFGVLAITSFKKTWRSIKKFILPAILALAIVPRYFAKAIDALNTRFTTSSDSMNARIANSFNIKWDQFEAYGIGASHPAVGALNRTLKLPPGRPLPPLESEMMKVVTELSIIGFILWSVLRLAVVFSLFKLSRQLKTSFLTNLALSAFLFHAIQFTGQIVNNHVMNIYYWFLGGFVFLLPELKRREKEYLAYQQYYQYQQVEPKNYV
jgi:hypothetical protein